MDKGETRVMEMFIRVRVFGSTRTAQFPATSRGGELFTQLNTIISELENQAATQSGSMRASREGTRLKAVALAELQDDMEAINRTARAMALTTPGLEEKFRLPRNASAQSLLAAARSFATDAEPIKAEFIKRGLPASFLEDLNATIEEIEQIIDRNAELSGGAVAASAAIDKAIDDGMKTVRELQVIVHNVFRNDLVTLAEWAGARHIERAPRQAATQPTTTPPAT